MPFNDLIQNHFTAAEIAAVDAAITAIETNLAAKCKNLTPAERQQMGSVNEQNKLLINKVRDYRNTQPAMSSPDVNWTEFEADYQDRVFLDTRLIRLSTLVEMMSDTKILHDQDNYQNSLLDYDFAKYKAGVDAAGGYHTKVEEIKQFFPATGGGNNNTP